MQTAVLIIGHGTREPEGTYGFLELVSSVQKQVQSYVQPSFLEITPPSVLEGTEHCLSTGAGHLLVIPLFLFGGQDIKRKLPQALEAARAKYPQLSITLSTTIGPDHRVLEILKERLESAMQSSVSADTAVLLVARGFSDQEAIAELEEVRVRFAQSAGLRVVRHAFVEIASPSIADGIESCLAFQAKQVVVLPYLLFPGLMLKKIKDQVEDIRLRQTGETQVLVADCLGPHRKLTELLAERIRKER
jgi:sirohydrochlorin cobaltochelatase